MKNKFVLFASIALLSLSSCGSGNHYEASEYVLNYEYKDGFKILQLTDTHIADKDEQDTQFAFLDSIIKSARADMIIVTGDLFTFASKATAKRYFDFLDSHGIPWTVTFGNHDEQCYFSIDWMTKTLNNYGSHCLFKDIQDDDVNGNSNFAINLTKDGAIKEQLIIMDSNRYTYGEYNGYDYFKKNQIDWYKDLVDYTTSQNNGTVVPSMMFYHIPLPEIDAAWDTGTDKIGEKRENTCPPEYNSGFFKVIKEKGSTHAMFFGHDHRNNFHVTYEGIIFAYGLKSDNRIYYDGDMLGGQIITINSPGNITISQIVNSYGEAK